MADWEPYRIRLGQEVEMADVQHIAHLPIAQRLTEDGWIKSGLIYDQSLLNRSRISVTWLSANTWANGSLYGTVAFKFPWADIINGRSIYWVEAITGYRPPAFRFLLSKREVAPRHVQPYDPTKDDGPLRLRNGKCYRAANFTSEFMVEDDLSLDQSTELSFVSHHPRYCNLNGGTCEDIQRQPMPMSTAAKMLAYTLARNHHGIDSLWNSAGVHQLSTPLWAGYSGLWFHLVTATSAKFGGALRRPESCGGVVMGALALYGLSRAKEAKNLLSLIQSEDHFRRALTKAVRRHFGEPKWKPF